MSFSNALKRAFLPLAMASTSLIATPAYALEMGADRCLPPAALMPQLKAEGQGSVVFADRVIPATASAPPKSVFVIFTANKDGTRGYSFEGDKPSGTPSTKFCLAETYNKAKGLDVSVSAIPDGVAVNSNLAKVINFSIKEKGFNPIFYGEANGAMIVIVGNPEKKSQLNGMILVGNNDPTRKADDLGGLMGLNYSPNYNRSFAMIGNNIRYAGLTTQEPKP